LYRPGNHAASVLVALGVGVMFTLSIYLIQQSLLREVMSTAPPGMPNVFLINITRTTGCRNEAAGGAAEPAAQAAAQRTVSARLLTIDGVAPDPEERQGFRHRHFRQAGRWRG